MDDFIEYTAVRLGGSLSSLLYYLAWAAIVLLGVVAVFSLSGFIGTDPETGKLVFSFSSLLIGLACGAAAFFAYRGKDNLRTEYDYAFTNGALDISSVLNSRRRRYLCALDTKDVIRCGPAAGPAFQKSLKEPDVKRHNWFVNREAKLYFFYFQKKGVKHLAVMELSDEMIAVIRSKKCLQIGAWYDADGKQSYAGIS